MRHKQPPRLPRVAPLLSHRQWQRRLLRLEAARQQRLDPQPPTIRDPQGLEELAALFEALEPGDQICWKGGTPGVCERFSRHLARTTSMAETIACVMPEWMPQASTLWQCLTADHQRDSKQVMEVCNTTGVDRWLQEWPMGPNTLLLGPDVSFSPAEREKLMLTMALLEQPDWLLWQDCGLLQHHQREMIARALKQAQIGVIRIEEPTPAHWALWQQQRPTAAA